MNTPTQCASEEAPSVAQAVAAFEPRLPLAVAFSGGADSSALLLACARRWPGQVRALHVHHGLQAAGDDFEAQCRSACERWGVPLAVRRVDAAHARGESPEDAARQARRKALVDMARQSDGVTDLALAHHADDQAETLLLALSRGAGLGGLSAMPSQARWGDLTVHRPLLDLPGSQLREWLLAQDETWIEDPSNEDERFTRNRIRMRLLPALQQAFPQFRATFARSARHAAQAQSLLAELAEQDLRTIGAPPAIAALQHLSRDRQANALRHWLQSAHRCLPSAAQLEALLDQVQACRTRGHRLHLKVGGGFIRREGDVLDWYNTAPLPPEGSR
ncbi:tRNA lysidine(34) synthetase TilS [Variovorax dokdonensis]|uniref:tRNA(Ile)-lysidine synthase n=1 Tax=Variovorax dokdonensis TaxID=344883 RepID=A0ABT7NCX9_9BURK|nr:tRNA lysidine(34) synthetase TilS [Variovorax dokdonensis]MDM0045806.1 tRNA lysidine(34) synthetase TilS [Variovorax dokdonensis]